MTIFDLLFLAAFLASVVTLISAAVFSIRGRNQHAIHIVWVWAVGVAVYLTTSAAVSAAKPQRVIPIGEPWCFDDWCLTAESVNHAAGTYDVALRISSTAKRVTQRALGAWIYLIDDQGRRFAPEPKPDAVPLDVLLQPGESVDTSRSFHVPADARVLGLITGHGGSGSYCGPGDLLIIGSGGCFFKKPTMIRLE